MKQLSGLDATFLHLETAEMPMHVGALNVYELAPGQTGSFTVRLRQHMAERLHQLPVLRRRLWWMPLNLANPAWVDADPDLKHHIQTVKLPRSARQGTGMAELEAAVGRLHAQRLDRGRPLWRFFVLEGLGPSADGLARVAIYSQFHHAAVDGQAAVAVARVILDTTPDGRSVAPAPPSQPGGQSASQPGGRAKTFKLGLGQMLRGALAHEATQVAGIIKNLPSTLGTLADAAGLVLSHTRLLRGKGSASTVSNLGLAPRTPFNASVTAARSFAGVSLPLAQLKALGRLHQATLNDTVLLLCATALRRYLSKHATLPRKSLVAAVPVSLRAPGDTTSDTQASMSLVNLGTHIPDLGKRLAHIKAATTAMKQTMGSLKSVLPTDYPSIGVPWLMEALTALYGRARVADRLPLLANLTISNVPGPPVPLYLAGARMVCNYPTSIVMHGLGLNITVESYDRQMDFGIVADAQAMPHVRALADAIQIAFEDLCLLEPPEPAGGPARPGLVQAGRSAVGQAGKRLTNSLKDSLKDSLVDGLTSVGQSMSGAVGKAVGGVFSGVVSGVVSGAVGGVVSGVVCGARGGARGGARVGLTGGVTGGDAEGTPPAAKASRGSPIARKTAPQAAAAPPGKPARAAKPGRASR